MSKDFPNFSVDKDIILHGLCLFGSKDIDYEVILEIKDSSRDNSTVVSKKERFIQSLYNTKVVHITGLKSCLTL